MSSKENEQGPAGNDSRPEIHRDGEITNASSCLAELAALVRGAYDENIRLQIRVGPNLPLIRCDRAELQNAILNLVFNARDAMPDGGVISIDAVAEGPRNRIVFRVVDSGVGMSPETKLRAFEPFFTTKGTGLGGVGLPIVRRFAEEHGGTVEIESALGRGTTVFLQLPSAPAAARGQSQGA